MQKREKVLKELRYIACRMADLADEAESGEVACADVAEVCTQVLTKCSKLIEDEAFTHVYQRSEKLGKALEALKDAQAELASHAGIFDNDGPICSDQWNARQELITEIEELESVE